MRNYLRGLMAIAKKDFRGFFAGPLFYVLSGLAFAILSWNFFYGTAQFIETAQGGAMAGFGGGGGYNIRELLFINHYVFR